MKKPLFDPGWPEDVVALYRHDMQEMWDPGICRNVFNMYHAQLEMYLAIAGPKPLRILDVGCAQGTLALVLAEAGHKVTAVDIRPQFLEYARARHSHGDVQFLQANILEEAIEGSFDLVFANQIIEHLVYPVRLCQRLASLLEPGGRLVMTTPNGRYVKNRLPSFAELGDPSAWEHMQFSADGDGHFYAYLPEELRSVFVDAGLDKVVCRPFETPVISGHMKVRHLHGIVPYRVLRSLDQWITSFPSLVGRFSHQLICEGHRPWA